TYPSNAAADAHADDASACVVFQIQTMTCFNALADDDNDSSDNRVTTNGYQVKRRVSAGRFQLDRFKPAGGRQVLPPARFARLRLLCHSELAGACPEWAGSLGEDTKGGANRECRRGDSRWGGESPQSSVLCSLFPVPLNRSQIY